MSHVYRSYTPVHTILAEQESHYYINNNKVLSFSFILSLILAVHSTNMKVVCQRIPCASETLQLKLTLGGGQSFRWKEIKDGKWRGVFLNKVWTLWNDKEFLYYEVESGTPNPSKSSKRIKSSTLPGDSQLNDEDLLQSYLRLDVPLQKFYSEWSKSDPLFEKVSNDFLGVRLLNQDVVENIFSFICSSNNNIIRISSMVEKLCLFYGNEIATVDGIKYYSFPKVTALADPSVESKLRSAGFGYRAKFIQQSAEKIVELGEEAWLTNLQKLPYIDAKKELMKLAGIGAKVADCICLMSLNHLEAIPVDTHVFQIAQRYMPHLKKCKTVTDKVYNEIGEYFRSLYGVYAGWAHTILFCADLRKFQDVPTNKEHTIESIKETKKAAAMKRKNAPTKTAVKKAKRK
ncbi:N-glycosylase/DNA lyase [Bemisia tabaci]|uniref:N-glycosylase/DNA lyase n=1 Tax=Bemisia tabaci TaxID=7038 RepID=UPI003B2871E4